MNKVITWTCKIFLALTAAILLAQGLLWGLFPADNLAANGIIADSTLALNMIKSDIGGGLVAAGIFLFMFVLRGNQWFGPMLIIGSAYFTLRLISFVMDGSHQIIIFGLVLEALVIIAMIALRKLRTPY